jgi:hypothetical protein
MKKLYSLSILLIGCLAFGQVSLTVLNTAYNQNFDGLVNSGTELGQVLRQVHQVAKL